MPKINSVDSAFSINERELKDLRNISEKIFLSLKPKKLKNLNEQQTKFFRRSIYISKDIKKNERITNKNINTLRPKIGICASKYFKIIGMKVNKSIKKDTPLKQCDIY